MKSYHMNSHPTTQTYTKLEVVCVVLLNIILFSKNQDRVARAGVLVGSSGLVIRPGKVCSLMGTEEEVGGNVGNLY